MSVVTQARNALGRWKGYSGCYRCGGTWDYTPSHDTPFENGKSCFPLCEVCWQGLTVAERLPYYRALVDEWIRQTPEDAQRYQTEVWPLILNAVRVGW